jgi:hypothetical protein
MNEMPWKTYKAGDLVTRPGSNICCRVTGNTETVVLYETVDSYGCRCYDDGDEFMTPNDEQKAAFIEHEKAGFLYINLFI